MSRVRTRLINKLADTMDYDHACEFVDELLDELRRASDARTLRDYRPQHDEDCRALVCGQCGATSPGWRAMPAFTHPDADGVRHHWQYQDCSCGLDALLVDAGGAA